MVSCPLCESNNREDLAFCGACGGKMPLTLDRLLTDSGLMSYRSTLARNHIESVAELEGLNDQDLTELGLAAGDRIRLRKALGDSSNRPAQPFGSQAPQSVGFAAVGSQAVQLFNTLGQAVGEALPVKTGKEKNWTIGTRLSGLLGFAFTGGNIIGPLSLWLWKKKESPLLDSTGKEVLNFQLSCFAYGIVAAVIDSMLNADDVALGTVAVFWLVLTAIGAYQAYQGNNYRYPLIFRPVK